MKDYNLNSQSAVCSNNKNVLNTIVKFITSNWFFIGMFIFLAIYTLSMFFIFGYGLLNSLKSKPEFQWNPARLPTEGWHLENYTEVMSALTTRVRGKDGFVYYNVYGMYLNTVLYAIGCGFLSTLVPCVTAYLTGRFKYKFSGIIVGIVIVTMSLPIVGSTPSSLQLARSLGLYNKIWGLWIMSAHFQMGIHFLVFHDAFGGFPAAYKEAAEIDGASNLRIMIEIY